MSLRPQDVVVAVKLALAPQGEKATYPELAAALEISLSEVHGAVRRATAAGLVSNNRKANRAALIDFLVQGVSRAFIPKRGPLTRGMPTAHGAPPLDRLVGSTAEPPPVWPDPDGTVRGESLEPLYPSVPRAAKKDPKLYEALCLIDAIRIGRSRDCALAEEHLRKLILPASDSGTSKRFSLDDPRRKRIVEALSKDIGPGTATYYRSALKLLALEPPVEATSHLVAHLATEIESSVRHVIATVMVTDAASPETQSPVRGSGKRSTAAPPDQDKHQRSIQSALAWLEIPVDSRTGRDWRGLAGKDNQASLDKRRHRENLEPPRPIDWDFWSRFEGILDEVLGAFEMRYASVFDGLDGLIANASPNRQDAERLRGALPQTEVALGYFFGRLNVPAWIEPLEKVGFFSKPPKPIWDFGGRVQYPLWPALQYLSRMAPQSPEVVAQVALALPTTENIEVRATLAEIARQLPAKLAEPFADKVDGWLTPNVGPVLGCRLTDNILGFLEKLTAEGSEGAARRIVVAVLRPSLPGDGENHSFPETRLATWDLRETLGRLAPIVLALGEPGLDVVAQSLDQTLDLACGTWGRGREDDSQYWCPDIETHAADYADHLLAHLVVLIRDTALGLVDSKPARLPQIVASFEPRRWVIFRRLALFLLWKYPSGAADAISTRLADRSCLELPGREYARLLRSSFAHLKESQQRTILSWIEQGPKFLAPSDPSGYADRWRMGWLGTIADALPEDWRGTYDALKAKVGEVPAVDEAPPRDTVLVGPTSPFRGEALAQMTPAELVSTVQSWKPSSEFGSPAPGRLSHTLASIVEQRPDTYAAAIEDLKRLDPTYLRGFLSGFGSAARAGRAFDWKPVVAFCAWIVSHPRQIPGREESPFGFDAHWGHARKAVLRLLSDGLTSRSMPIPVELRTVVWSAIEPTLDDPDDAEGIGKVKDRPMDHLPYRVQGLAMVTTVEYASWVARGTGSKGLPEEVRAALDKKIRAGSVAVRVALADRIGTMAYLDSAWTESHVHALFRANEEGRDLAWEAYLHDERLTLDAFHLLHWRYSAAVDELRPDVELNHHSEELAGHVANDLGRLYWHGQLDFGERDKLLDRFFANAPAKITGKLVENLGHWLHTDRQPAHEVLARLKALWARREAAGQPEELAEFGWWFSSGCFEEGWAADNLLHALEKLDGTGLSPRYAPKMGEQLAELIPQHLAKAASCLELLVKANENGWAVLDLRSAARAILAASLASGDSSVQRVAKATISRLARKGYLDFRDLL